MVNLFYDCYSVLSKVYCDKTFIKQAILKTTVEPINKQKTVKICYGVLDKDVEFDYYLDRLCERSPKQKIRILLKIAFYALKYLEKKPYAVIDATVELVKKLGKGGNAAFCNAVLRRFVSEDIPLPDDEIGRLSVKYSYPAFAVEKLIACYGKDTAERIMGYDEEKTFVRFDRGYAGEKYLVEKGYKFEKTPFYNLFAVEHAMKNEDFDNGIFTFQSIGSVAICETVGSGNALLDACAGPGGKSVYLADKFASITAVELHEHRAELIKTYCERMKKGNVEIVCADSSVNYPEFDSAFDSVLCDVPCSAYGTLKSNPDVKLRRSAESVSELSETQLSILKNCSAYVKIGGSLIYSTCSVFDEENDGIVGEFLKTTDGFIVENYSSPLPAVQKNYGLQFLPHLSFGAGFYCSKLKRIK